MRSILPLTGLLTAALLFSCAAPATISAADRTRAFAKGKKASPGQMKALGIEWVAIPGGRFLMGSADVEKWNSTPRSSVTVEAFQMAKTEVTVEQYAACVKAGRCREPGMKANEFAVCNWGVAGREKHPINCIDIGEAQDFASWVGGRLPTSAEWEYAARSAGRDWVYPWGSDDPSCERAVMNDGGAGCGRQSTWPVCSKPKGGTLQGLCDMAGNVREWVDDPKPLLTKEEIAARERSPRRTEDARGGSWRKGGYSLRVTDTSGDDVHGHYRVDTLGVRPVRQPRKEGGNPPGGKP